MLFISQFTTHIYHISGKQNIVADTLSRADEEANNENSVKLSSNTNSSNNELLACSVSNVPINLIDSPNNACLDISFSHCLENEILVAQSSDIELKGFLSKENFKKRLTVRNKVVGEMHDGKFKPFVPKSLRFKVFEEIHNISHPGGRATLRLVRDRFFWPEMNKDIKQFSRTCIPCQKSKIARHNSPPMCTMPMPHSKFTVIHADIVGPLSSRTAQKYILTVVDRFSRWPVAIPLENTSSETIAKALLFNWFSCYGIPETIVTDRGSNFISSAMLKLTNTLGCERIKTTAYNPQGNSIVERFHRRLKEALRATCLKDPLNWIEKIPLILLSLRTATREDAQCSPSQIVYGCNLRLPIDLVMRREDNFTLDASKYAERLVAYMQEVGPIITRKHPNKYYLDPTLEECQQVFVRDESKRGLNPVYKGPFRILEKHKTYFKVDLHGRVDNVHIKRLKAAHTMDEILNKNEEIPSTITIYEPDELQTACPTRRITNSNNTLGTTYEVEEIVEPNVDCTVDNDRVSIPNSCVNPSLVNPVTKSAHEVVERATSSNSNREETMVTPRRKKNLSVTFANADSYDYVNKFGRKTKRPFSYSDDLLRITSSYHSK